MKPIVLSSLISCSYSVLTVFSWIKDMKYTYVRTVWWIATIMFCLFAFCYFVAWLLKENEK